MSISGLSNETKLEFYGLYKQASCGVCTVTRPGYFDFKGITRFRASIFCVFLWDLESLRRLRLSVEFYSVTISGQAKYDAWSSLGDLSQSDAMLMYIDLYNR